MSGPRTVSKGPASHSQRIAEVIDYSQVWKQGMGLKGEAKAVPP